ncbi:hypothetical protein UFOVP1138_55 [uncultured Caudovirales phage]|uniref:Uncharacterized protein n=1 Tax=uncultured Caudovirales phage TaxID=2100421 RepID=A0A6J5S7K6_9CAUD|nr:hypothetical protein UFOVP975_65 [uncultured Caudovirales phage]CAB4186279.1 hypothetical protein UFOVP1138_55 [uncultured Caudovirales phage]CAB4204432.1 hypothetical protein UFOVP1394_52 [uncultured Caudovirales phage]
MAQALSRQPWFCDVHKQAKVIDRVADRSQPHNRKEIICQTTVKIWDKFDNYCKGGIDERVHVVS